MLAQLLPVNGGPPVTLSRAVTVVGRSPRLCDLPLENKSVSKLHCILVKTDGLVYMRDLGSTNGTRVNGQRVLRGALLPGDQISFSGSVYKVHLAPDPEEPESAAPPAPAPPEEVVVEPEVAESSAEDMAPIVEIMPGDARNTSSDVRLLSDEDLVSDDSIS